ncbi:MAG: hypothetical protein SGBAC_007165 [Bacillariaceae sp.]
MLRSNTESRGNGNIRSRPSTPAGASRSNDNKKEGYGVNSQRGEKLNFTQSHVSTTPIRSWAESSASESSRNGRTILNALHESGDEKKDEECYDVFYPASSTSNHGQQQFSSRAVPGRATRQRRRRKRSSHNHGSWTNLFFQGGNPGKSTVWQVVFRNTQLRALLRRLSDSNLSTLIVAVALWYSLGVISIATSKLLLFTPSDSVEEIGASAYYAHVGGLAPIMLTFQQLLLGSTFLRFLHSTRFLQSSGVQPLARLCDSSETGATSPHKSIMPQGNGRQRHGHDTEHYGSIFQTYWQLLQHKDAKYLCYAGLCFSLGFYCTNLGFQAASAAFVETIKASEPITSAILAVAWGLELLNRREVTSLALIVCGVILSTLGNSPSTSATEDNDNEDGGFGMGASLISCTIVMTSNLCFSFRGLFQKVFQKRSKQSILMDDLNLQYRMQQMGVLVFGVPALLWEGRSVLEHIFQVSSHIGLIKSGVLIRYVGLATANAMAFASYKYVSLFSLLRLLDKLLVLVSPFIFYRFSLASTYLLSRISVVHHAALNCIRRIFAIVVTSILFASPISRTGVLGILISFGGFMSFTHAKAHKKHREKPNLLPLTRSQS